MTRRAPSGRRNSPGGASSVVYPISLCMIVRNEEHFLRDALTSVEGVVDEICIVDTGSTDGTIAVAESFGARITHIAWRDDFAWARNASLALATGAWILVLDADERLAPGSRDALRALRSERPDGQGRWLRCRNLKRRAAGDRGVDQRDRPDLSERAQRFATGERCTSLSLVRARNAASVPRRPRIEIFHYGYLPEIMSERSKGDRNFRLSRAAAEAAPDDPALAYNYATSALLAGERDTARVQFEHVVALTRNTPRGFRPMSLATLAGVYLDDGRPADALALAEECVGIVKTLPDGHFVHGRALAALGRHEEARAALRQAIAVGTHPSIEHFVTDDEIATWKAHNEIGGTFVSEGRHAEAQQWLDQALQIRPAEVTLLLNRARCAEALGDLAGARGDFERSSTLRATKREPSSS